MNMNHSHCRRSLLLGALCLFAGLPWAGAQRMSVAEKDAAAVSIETATVSTEVAGRYAVTTFDLVFRNPNNRPLEGTFEFPLLEGQSVIRFALDIDGHLREAVPVEKEKGRVVFEEIERRRVDPGLLEQTAGNNYRARVFPLPAQGTRRIVIAYQEELARGADGGATYRLPLAFPSRLARFDLGVAVFAGASEPARASTTLALELPAWSAERTLKVSRRDFVAQGVLELALPPSGGQSLITQKCEGREYFSAEVPLPEYPAADRAAPRVVGLLWDASGSGRGRDHAKEYAFLDAWFRAVPEVEVHLVRVRDEAEPVERFSVRGGDWTALRQALETTVYDGATSLDGVGRDRAVDEWLLFSEGLFNYGRRDPAAVLAELRAPVHAVLAGVAADATRLRAWSRASGGELANLSILAPAQAAAAVRRLPLRVWGVERDPEAVAQFFPEVGATIMPERLIVTGVLRRDAATVRLRIGRSEREAREVSVVVTSGAGAGSMAARAWAAAKIETLSLDAERNRNDIRRTSLAFGIVTAGTSLIVLESAADYALYEIEPPAELRREWKELRRERAVAERKSRESHLDSVAADHAERIKWWETRPAKTKRAKEGEYRVAGEVGVVLTPSEIPSRRAEETVQGDSGAGGGGAASPDQEVVVLSPFLISSDSDNGYRATATLAGTRVRTELRDVGSAIHVVTDQFLRAAGASNSGSALQYSTNTEVGGARADERATASIALQLWTPNAGYLDHLKRVASAARYATYLEERADHLRDVGFFVDVAGFFLAEGEAKLGLRILSNLAEMELEEAALLRVLGHRLLEAARADLAVPVFERVLRQRGEEPQSRRDLALACAADRQYQRAIDLLWEVVEKPWHGRFPGIELLALGELNSIVATCGERLDLSRIDRRLRRDLPVGLRVVLTWDADNCDIDLWVDDPEGERAFYGHQRTTQGGLLSCDFTGGYGPEEFMIRRPLPGKYTVRINYFGDRRNTALGPVTAQVRLITGYGTPQQKEERMTVRLDSEAKVLEIGSIEVGAKCAP